MKKIASYFFASVLILNMICTTIPSQLVYADNVQNSTSAPASEPTSTPASEPTSTPASEPTSTPTSEPTSAPASEPTSTPASEPTSTPTSEPTSTPASEPTSTPASEPTSTPASEPTSTPASEPTSTPASEPTSTPASEPTSTPASEPTSTPDSKAKDAPQPAPVAPSGYTLGKTKDAISQSETARVYVNNSLPKTVIENFTYTLSPADAAKATVDADGNVSVKEGYSPVAGDSVTVNVGIEYYQGDSVLFYDSLDDDETKFTRTSGTGIGTYVKNNVNPHSGTKSAYIHNPAGGGAAYLSADLGAEYKGTLTYWFYDAKIYGVMLKEGFGFSPSATKPVINMFGFDQESSDSASSYKIRAGSKWSSISVPREKGWKKIQFVADGTNTKAYIDGAEVYTFAPKTIRYPMFFNAWPGGTPDKFVLDDISFVSENAALISETLSTTVSLTATAHTLPKTEFDYNKTTKAKVSVEVLPSAANLKAVQCNQTAVTAEQYEVVGKNVNILPAYLDTLAIGKHTFTFLLGNESKDININVIDNVKTAQNTYSFCTSTESSEYKDVSIAFELNGNAFTDVKYKNSSVEKANYSFNNGALVLTKEFLATLAVGNHTFEATFDKSEPVQIDIGVFAATINITANLSAVNVKLNAPINFAVEAQVSPAGDAISYQWFVCDDANKTNAAPVAGETAKNYNIAQAKISVHNGKYYYCKLSANGVADAFTDVVLVTVTSDSITSLPQPTVLTLEENGKISYSLVEHAVGYTASLYKDDVLVTGTEDTNAETASFLNVMRTQGIGTYTVKLIAIGDKDNFNNSAPKTSSAIVISQLPAPLNLVWNGEAGAWDAAANATGYELQLYKNSVAVGEPISLEKKETYDFSSLLKRKGDYTFTVKAIGGEQSIYLSSQPSVASGVFACTKSGISLAMPTALVSKGDSKRVYLNGFDGYAIREVVYSTPDTTKVDLNAVTGEITIKPDYTPTKGEKITVNAQVKYNDEVLFADSFEQDEKTFIDKTAHTGKSGNPNSYKHSQTNSHWGQKAATAVQGSVGPAGKIITTTAGQTGVVTAWYYDEADPAEIDVKGAQAKFGFSMNAVGKKRL